MLEFRIVEKMGYGPTFAINSYPQTRSFVKNVD